ncbi:MAG: large-conductance mechanosensitive channel protein MscL [Oscillospiraceae bacterium]|nr:large-conductance mechanosensitive channel protein MscL [Oscillospiraceae bacterium]
MAEEKKVEKKERFKLAKEFKAFISKGNVLDMAVGLIVGSAFTAIVNSLVGDLLMPLLGLLTGKMDFSQLKLVLQPAVEEVLDETGAVVTPAVAEISLNYGAFIQSVISFLLIALAVFTLVKILSKLHRKKAEEPKPEPKPDPQIVLLTEIRDLLKEKETTAEK